MKNILILFVIFSINGYGQNSFLKRYYVKIVKHNDSIVKKLNKEITIPYKKLGKKEQYDFKESLENKFKGIKTITYTINDTIFGKIVPRTVTKQINDEFIINQSLKKKVDTIDFHKAKASVFFGTDDNKLYINTWAIKKKKSERYKKHKEVYFYELKNYEKVNLYFVEGNVSTFVIPIKYRNNDDDKQLKEEFSSSFNANLFIGISAGMTSFTHRKKVKNKINTSKLTLGLFLGTSTVTLDKGNTSLADQPLIDDTKIVKGLGSFGFGLTYSFNKLNLGVFNGRDYSIGKYASKWNYNKKPWWGIGIGYSIFDF